MCCSKKIVNFGIINHLWINFALGICLLITIDTDIMHRRIFHEIVNFMRLDQRHSSHKLVGAKDGADSATQPTVRASGPHSVVSDRHHDLCSLFEQAGGTRSKTLLRLAVRIGEFARAHTFHIQARHISGHLNVLADLASRAHQGILSGREGLSHRRSDVPVSIPACDIRVSSSLPSQDLFAEAARNSSFLSSVNPPVVAISAMEAVTQPVQVCASVAVASVLGPIATTSLGPSGHGSEGT